MKLTVVIVTLILMTLVDEGATWGWPRIRVPRISVRRILKKVCNPICTTKCVEATGCLHCNRVCSYGCHETVCKWIGKKRSEPQVIITPSYLYEKLTISILLKLLFIRRACLINKRPQFIS